MIGKNLTVVFSLQKLAEWLIVWQIGSLKAIRKLVNHLFGTFHNKFRTNLKTALKDIFEDSRRSFVSFWFTIVTCSLINWQFMPIYYSFAAYPAFENILISFTRKKWHISLRNIILKYFIKFLHRSSHWRCCGGVLWKKVFFKILQNSQENACARVSSTRLCYKCFPVNFAKF